MDPIKPRSPNPPGGRTIEPAADEPSISVNAPRPQRSTGVVDAGRSGFSAPRTAPVATTPPLPQGNPVKHGGATAAGPTVGPVTDPTIGPVTDPTIGERAQRGAGAAAARTNGPASQGPGQLWTHAEVTPLERGALVELHAATAHMDPATAKVLLDAAQRHPNAAPALMVIATSEAYQSMSSKDREQLQQVIRHSGLEGLRHLGAIVSKDPQRLADAVPAPNKGTVLSELARLCRNDLHPLISSEGVSKGQALDSVLADVANPRDIFQGAAGTCTVTSMQYDLVSREPGEYVRIMADLATSGRSTLRGDGNGVGRSDVLRLQTEYLVPTRVGDKRRLTENWFQSAAMELANGKLEYRAQSDVSINEGKRRSGEFAPGEAHPGLYGAQQQRMLQALFGVGYTLHEATPGSSVELLRKSTTNADSHPVILNLQFDGHAPGGTQGPVTDPTIGAGEGRASRGSHAVTFSHIEGSGSTARVYFRDPWGHGEDMPPAVWDPNAGMYFMDAATFESRCERLHIADDRGRLRDRFLALGAVFGFQADAPVRMPDEEANVPGGRHSSLF